LEKTEAMKILAINGSHRGDKGHTHFLINKLFQGAAATGAECEMITLAKLKINRCLACGQYHTDEHSLQCVYDDKDDVRAVFQKMAGADMIIYGTPIYVFGMSGLLKTFIDRMNATGNTLDLRMSKKGLMFHHIDRAVCSKPFVVLVCCDNLETEPRRTCFTRLSRLMDVPQGRICAMVGGYQDMSDPTARKFLRYLGFMLQNKRGGNWPEKAGSGMERNAPTRNHPVLLFGILKRLRSIPKRRFIEERGRCGFDSRESSGWVNPEIRIVGGCHEEMETSSTRGG
jgi:putative NADPH-quinone reductase